MNRSIETFVVFEASRLGYDLTRVPALILTPRGTLLAFCEARKGPGYDWAAIDILISRSVDGGTTWSAPRVMISGGKGPASNPVPIVGRDSTIHFLCQTNYSQCHYFRSGDNGLTWSNRRDITPIFEEFRGEYDWKVLAPGPGHGIQLSNGRLLAPVWLCNPVGRHVMQGGDHRPSCVATISSDDGGATWKRGDIVLNTREDMLCPSESALVELGDGSVLINIRSEGNRHRRIISRSPDGLTGWSPPAFDDALYEPVCMAGLLGVDDPRTGKRILLFCNPDSRHVPEELNCLHFCSRENGTVKLSHDDGKTWPHSRVITPGPFGYSDLACDSTGMVYCLYDAGEWDAENRENYRRVNHKLTHVALSRFSLDWIERK